MNIISKTNGRPTLSLPFGKKSQRPSPPAPAAILSSSELKRLVAAMLG